MKVEAIVLEECGGPEQLKPKMVEVGSPGPGEILVRHEAIAVNFHDCYVRAGLYRTLHLPGIPGLEGVGIVEAVGPDEARFIIGDRVGWISPAYGGYVAARVLPSEIAFHIPNFLSSAQACASVMKAMTVNMLVRRVCHVRSGQTVLVQAAAGGVGQLLCMWLRHIGATVIGTVGDEAKARVAQASGAHHTILYRSEDFVARVREITAGRGVDIVYDSVGADTCARSFECLDYQGALVSYGQSSGAPPAFHFSDLAARSLTVSRPILFHYIKTREALDAIASEIFEAFGAGILKPIEPIQFPLAAAADAHRMIEARKSPGGIVLLPVGGGQVR